MRRALVGLRTYVTFVLTGFAFLVPMSVCTLLHRADLRRRGRWLRRMGRVTVRAARVWNFGLSGEPPADIATKPYVVVANHRSSADPFLLSWLPWDMRWVAKEELFKVPLTGWLLSLGADIRLSRGDRQSGARMMRDALRTLRSGLSVMLFPEGTRSKDGSLLRFRDGAFRLAIAAQVPVLPVVVRGTESCMPKGSLWIGESHATAEVLAPIPTAGLTEADVPMLRELVRERIAEALLRAPRAPVVPVGESAEVPGTLVLAR